MESQERIFMIGSSVDRTRGNRAINAALDENYGEILKSGDNTLLKYKIFDGDGEILPLEGLPCEAVIKKEDNVVYRTPAEVDAENVVSFKITEVLPSDRNNPYTIEFIITQGQDTLIFPSDDRINLYIYPSSLSADGDIINQTPESRLNEIVIVAVNDATQEIYLEVDNIRETLESEFEANESDRQQEFEANEVDRQANETIRKSQEESREIAETARRETYDDLIDTGVMQENINQKLAESEAEYAPRLTELEQNDAELTTQLAQKVDKGNVSVNDINKNLGKFDGTYFSDSFLSDLTNGEIDVTNVLDGSITDDKLAFPAVTGTKSKNLYNSRTSKHGVMIEGDLGEEVARSQYFSSDYINVLPNTAYVMTFPAETVYRIVAFNEQKVAIDYSFGYRNYTTPPDTKYVRITGPIGDIHTAQIEQGNVPTSYMPFGAFVEDEKILSVSSNKIIGEIDPRKLKGVNIEPIRTVNLFDKDNIISGGWYSPTTGKWLDGTTHVSSEFIPVESGIYKRTGVDSIVRWDKDKNYISGSTYSETLTVGSNTHFITFAIRKDLLDSTMFTLESEFPDTYVPYTVDGYKFDDSWETGSSDSLAATDKEVDTLNKKVDEMANMYSEVFTEPIELVLNDFSGYNQPYHPSAIYIPGGFNGYEYWLVQTPYPIGASPYRDRWEVPIVYKSHDGIEWITVADPLDDLIQSEIDNGDYMSDPHILYRQDTSTLEVWYRITHRVDGKLPTTMLRQTTIDGENWSPREEMIPPVYHDTIDNFRSPSITWSDFDSEYQIYYQNNYGIFYNTSKDGTIWNNRKEIELGMPFASWRFWHIDVNYYNGRYHLLIHSRTEDIIEYFVSDDGINFNFVKKLLDTNEGNPLYSTGLYRAVSLLDENNKVRVYFTAETENREARIGLMIADSIEEMNGIQKVDSEMVITKGGVSVEKAIEDLTKELNDLKQQLANM